MLRKTPASYAVLSELCLNEFLDCWHTNRNVRSSRIRFYSPSHRKSWPTYFTSNSSVLLTVFVNASPSGRGRPRGVFMTSYTISRLSSTYWNRFGQCDTRQARWQCRLAAPTRTLQLDVPLNRILPALWSLLQRLSEEHWSTWLKYSSQHHATRKNFTGIILRSQRGLSCWSVDSDEWNTYSAALRYKMICFVSHRNPRRNSVLPVLLTVNLKQINSLDSFFVKGAYTLWDGPDWW